MSSRDAILSRIRRALGTSGSDPARRAEVDRRLAGRPAGVIPTRGQIVGNARVELFETKAREVMASVVRIADADDIPAAILVYLMKAGLPPAIRRGDDPRLADLAWGAAGIAVSVGRSFGDDLVAVSFADGGVAETGTLVLTSGPHNPSTLNFLPDHHIVAVAVQDIESDYEAIWARLGVRYGYGLMPRTVNLITGPSRSADIEQTLLLGAHGPRSLHILVVG